MTPWRVPPLVGAALVVGLLAACAQQPKGGGTSASALTSPLAPADTAACRALYQGGPGDKVESAVVLLGAKDEYSGIRAEHEYVKKCLPDWSWGVQSVMDQDGKIYDRIDLTRLMFREQAIYFDITSWFGVL